MLLDGVWEGKMKRIILMMVLHNMFISQGAMEEMRIKKPEHYYTNYHSDEESLAGVRQSEERSYGGSKAVEERRLLNGEIDEIIKFTFDRSNRLVAIDVWNEMKDDNRREIYEYSGDKVVTKKVFEKGVLVDKEVNTYDTYDRLINTRNKKGIDVNYVYDKDGRVVMKTDDMVENIYSYDREGNLKKDVCQVDGVVIYSREYEYDSRGRVVMMTEYKPNGFQGRPACTRETYYEYNTKGDKVEERWRDNYEGDWKTKRIENIYNTYGDVVMVREYQKDKLGEETLIREHQYKYEYH